MGMEAFVFVLKLDITCSIFPNAYWIQALPSPDQQAEQIRDNRDGTMPRYPYQRCSQSIFEAWLKALIQEEPLIDSYFGMKFETTTESTEKVRSTVTNVVTGTNHVIESQYVVGCDGASSRVRTSTGITLATSPM